MKISIYKFLGVILIFLMGFFSANLISFYLNYGLENPFSSGFSVTQKQAPSDYIKENQVEVFDDRIVIHISNASLSEYAATGSMKPVLDENSNGIRITPKSEKDIHVGDIITFQENDYLVVHRVIEIGEDSQGTYFITKGDNNNVSDGKVRFRDIKYITIGILW